jgi:hypothetical protein
VLAPNVRPDNELVSIAQAPKGFKPWCDADYTSELLPIIPPGVELSVNSTVRPEDRGKTPGVRNSNGTWSGLTGRWSKDFHATLDDCERWHQWGANVGLQTRCFPAVDIDIEDADAAAEIEHVVLKLCGPAPVRFRAGSSHRLLLYRLPADAEPFRKLRKAFHDPRGRKHAVELLGFGQQTVVGGKHKSGAELEWRGSPFAALHPLEHSSIERLFHA